MRWASFGSASRPSPFLTTTRAQIRTLTLDLGVRGLRLRFQPVKQVPQHAGLRIVRLHEPRGDAAVYLHPHRRPQRCGLGVLLGIQAVHPVFGPALSKGRPRLVAVRRPIRNRPRRRRATDLEQPGPELLPALVTGGQCSGLGSSGTGKHTGLALFLWITSAQCFDFYTPGSAPHVCLNDTAVRTRCVNSVSTSNIVSCFACGWRSCATTWITFV